MNDEVRLRAVIEEADRFTTRVIVVQNEKDMKLLNDFLEAAWTVEIMKSDHNGGMHYLVSNPAN